MKASANRLRIVGRAGEGYDNIDVTTATDQNIMVMNTPGANTVSSAQLALSHMFSIARNIPQGHISMQEGAWDRKKYMGYELRDKTLGLIGCGMVGSQLASYAQSLGMKVVCFDPIMSNEEMTRMGLGRMHSLDALLGRSDFISLHTPDIFQTEDLIRKETLDKCKVNIIVNLIVLFCFFIVIDVVLSYGSLVSS